MLSVHINKGICSKVIKWHPMVNVTLNVFCAVLLPDLLNIRIVTL